MTHPCTCSLLVLVLCGASGCTSDRISGPAGDPPVTDSLQTLAFADTSLERAVRAVFKETSGPLTPQLLATLTQLSARGHGIIDLTGAEYLYSLTALDLTDNQITDLTPLASLRRLRFLDLTNNHVQDLSPLRGLSELESLALTCNQVRDLAPILDLMQLRWVELSGNPLSQALLESQLTALRARGAEVVYASADGSQDGTIDRPDNQTRIAFLSNRDVEDGYGYLLYTIRPDGTDLIRTSDHRYLSNIPPPRYSPQYDRLVFAEYSSDSQRTDVYIAGVHGEPPQNITAPLLDDTAAAITGYRDPFWSPQGDHLGLWVRAGLQTGQLLLLDLHGGSLRRFFADEALNTRYQVSVSPRWDCVAFLSGEGAKPGTNALFVCDVDGTNPRLLLDAVVDNRASAYYEPSYLVWSPDGQQIAFVSNRDGNQEIYVIQRDGSGLTRLTHNDGHDTVSAWSPDGQWLAYNTNREYRWEVFVVDRLGESTYNLTNSFADDYVCAWLPGL